MAVKNLLAGACIALSIAGAVQASAPKPKKPIHMDRFMGRWYEIARTPNPRQKGCFAASAHWVRAADGRISVSNTCRKGSPSGREDVTRATVHAVDGNRASIEIAFFGGVIRQEYWILDRADDYQWAIMGTPGGNYVWVFSRKANLSPAERNSLLGRVRALGYNIGKLEMVAR